METYAVLALAHSRAERLAKVVTLVTLLTLVLGVVILAIELTSKGTSKSVLAWMVASVFVIGAVPISSLDIQNHLLNFEVPELQKYIVRVLFMVPVYSVTCWMCLGNENLYIVMESMRSLYEAFVIWSFTYFLMAYLGPDQETIVLLLAAKPQAHHIFPVNYMLRPWRMGYEFLNLCKAGTLQYVVWKIANVFIVLVAQLLGVYGDGEWVLDRVYLYVVGITNCSQMLAIYCLVLFYKATAADLAPIKPLAKFLCIKAVVFFSFWQGCLVSALVYFGVIKDSDGYFTADVYAKSLQDFVICIEMLFFAIAHHYVFSYRDFKSYGSDSGVFATVDTVSSSGSSFASNGRRPLVQALLEAANPRDLVHDIRHNVRRFRNSGSGSFSSVYDNNDDHEHSPRPGDPDYIISLAAQASDAALDPKRALEDDLSSDDEGAGGERRGAQSAYALHSAHEAAFLNE